MAPDVLAAAAFGLASGKGLLGKPSPASGARAAGLFAGVLLVAHTIFYIVLVTVETISRHF